MGVMTITSLAGTGAKTNTEGTLTSSDTFTYTQGLNMRLRLRNTTAGALTPNLVGSAAASTTYQDGGTVNYAAGLTLASIPATTGDVTILLDRIPAYLAGGTVTVTGGTGLKYVLDTL